MFKVECPGCKAPYQVDERRIPANGLQMRCPKCGTSFQVDPPGDARRPGSGAIAGAVLGIESDQDSYAPAALEPPRAAPAVPAAPPLPRPRADLKGTMIGMAPGGGALPGAPPMPPRPAAPAAPRPAASLKGTMIGVAPAAPAAKAPPPLRRPAAPAAPAAAAPATSVYDDADLPAVGGVSAPPAFDALDLPDVTHAASELALPSLAGSQPKAPAPAPSALSLDIDLPAARTSSPDGALDLDLPARAPPRPKGASPPPAPAAPRPSVGLPAPAGMRAASPEPFALDLPDVPGTDLPALGGVDLPSLGSAGGAELSGVDLDYGPDLPAERGIGLPSLAGTSLPSPGGVALPSLAGAGLPASAGVGLPSVAQAGLPTAGGVSLPSVAQAGLPSTAGASLPSVAQAGLPSAAAATLPSVAHAGLPTAGGASLPSVAQAGLPTAGGPGLPLISAGGLPVVGGPGLPTPSTDSRQIRSALPTLDGDFGLDPLPPRQASGEFGALDLSGPPSGPSFDDAADPFGEAPIPSRGPNSFGAAAPPSGPAVSQRAVDDAIVRQAGGGTDYGEVNLEGESGDVDLPLEAGEQPQAGDDDMEFGGVPQEDQRPEAAPTHVSMDVGGALAEVPSERRRLAPRLYAGLFVVLVGGSSLALLPYVGPFGAYWVIDRVRAGDYARLVADTVKSAQQSLAEDSYPAAKRALGAIEQARARARRVRQLASYDAFVAYALELRFGSEPAVHARASVLLDELAGEDTLEFLSLARAARAASEGQLARARQLLDAAARQGPSSIDVAVLRGELELRARDPKSALAAWRAAAALEHSARTSFGLARAHYAAEDPKAAEALLREALGKNAADVGAKILLARITSKTREGEAEATRMLEAIAKDPASASSEEVVGAETLLGDIHLSRSRISLAEAAYNQALKINPKAARALNGLGDALYRAGRYSEAQARFEASAQADPDDLSAKIGVAKSKLALERVEEARGLLGKLREMYPNAIAVSYWYGRVLEALGDRQAAETTYQEAIKQGTSGDPQVVDAYIALAMLQSQQGRNDDAQKTLAEARGKLPNLPAIHKALGDVALSQGRYADAVQEFRQALELDPDDLASRFKLGSALRRDGKYDQASATFDEVSHVDAEYPGLALERGLLYEASGKSEEALNQYESALAKAPNDPDLMLRVGCGKVSAGHPKQAEELLRKVLSQRPISAETNHCLGRALLLEGTRLADSLRLLERATELDPNRAEYFLYVGWAANEAGNVPKAERALGEALRLDQGLADAYWQRGVLRQRQGAVKDAINDLTRALSLRPSRFEAHAALADAYYDLGKEAQALGEWQIAVQADPNNATWRFRYGKLLAVNHQPDQARLELGKALELSANADPEPRWTWEAHHLLARVIGLRPEAIKHWEEFLRLGPRDSPYRAEAKSSLEKLGKPWTGD